MFSERLRDILAPSKALAGQLELQYRQAVGQKLTDIISTFHSSSVVFSKMRGAFPSDVVEYSAGLKFRCQSPNDQTIPAYNPQLHALSYEWYFTGCSANEISREFVSRRGLTICMGVPTVASAAIAGNKNVVFIDKNAHSLIRFPELMRASEVHVMDAVQARRVSLKADALVFDPPWYAGDTLAWLRVASHLVKPGGTILFALYPSLVRPTAKLERDLILEVASTIGSVNVVEDSLAYETPLFEHEALKACGVFCVGNWRHGDLVVVKNSRPMRTPVFALPLRSEVDGRWKTFLIGPQVVKVRNSLSNLAHASDQIFLSTISGSFVFPAVSARNGTRESIHVWTSKNRVAGVANVKALSDILGKIASGVCLGSAVQSYEGQFGMDIRGQLNAFLGLED